MPTSTASSRNRKLYLFALGPLLAGVVLSLFGPSGEIAPVRFFEAMLRPDSGSPESLIFWSLRIPRTLAVLLCGAALSAAGLLLQRTLHNDLASPGILGINAGAGFFALLSGLLFPGLLLARGLLAFAGALGAVAFVLLLSHRIGSSKSSILLLGIAISTMMTALSNGVVTAFPETVPDKVAFSMGGFHAVSGRQIIFSACAAIPALILCLFLHRGIGMLALGDEASRRYPVLRFGFGGCRRQHLRPAGLRGADRAELCPADGRAHRAITAVPEHCLRQRLSDPV